MKNVKLNAILVLSLLLVSGLKAQNRNDSGVPPKTNAFKVALFSMAIGKLDFGYEKLVGNGISAEVRVGYSFENDVLANPATGGFAKAGIKFIVPYTSKTTAYNQLSGFYIRPEFSVGAVSLKYGCQEDFTGIYHRANRWSMAVMLSGGFQAVIRDRFLIDLYGGIGSGSSFNMSSIPGLENDVKCVNRSWQRYLGHSLLTNSFPIALTSGISFGFIFKSDLL